MTVVGPDQVGLLRRFGRYQAPLLQPGLHLRAPVPIESVTLVEPERLAGCSDRPDESHRSDDNNGCLGHKPRSATGRLGAFLHWR